MHFFSVFYVLNKTSTLKKLAKFIFAATEKRISILNTKLDRVKRIWYLSHMRAAKVQASLRIRAVSPEPPLLAHTSIESRGTFRQKTRSLAPLNGWACAVKICHDGMLEDTKSLDGAQIILHLLLLDNNVCLHLLYMFTLSLGKKKIYPCFQFPCLP